jgi:Tol biopolymer transport system component
VSLALNIIPIFTAAPNGTLVLRAGAIDAVSAVVVRPDGGERVLFGAPGLWSPRFSQDGSRIAYARTSQDRIPGGRDIWVYSIREGTSTRLTAGLQGAVDPAWSPDGRRIVFSTNRGNNVDLMSISADGGAEPTLLLDREGSQYQATFTPDGKRIVFVDAARSTTSDVLAIGIEPAARVDTLLASQFFEQTPAVSPDGRWLAYQSTETGVTEVYIRSLTGSGARSLVSAEGGREPAWSRDGKTLYYRTGNRVVGVRLVTGTTATVQDRVAVLETQALSGRGNRNYDVAPDGSGFLMLKSATPARLVVRLMALSAGTR